MSSWRFSTLLPPLVFAMFLVTMSTRILGESFLPLGASDSSGRGFNWHCASRRWQRHQKIAFVLVGSGSSMAFVGRGLHVTYRGVISESLHSLFAFPFSRRRHPCPYWPMSAPGPASTWVSCGNLLGTRCRHGRGQNWVKGYSCSFGRPGSRVHMARQATTFFAMPMFYIRNSIICILGPC